MEEQLGYFVVQERVAAGETGTQLIHIVRRQNQQDQVMTAHWGGKSQRLLTPISLTFKVLFVCLFICF